MLEGVDAAALTSFLNDWLDGHPIGMAVRQIQDGAMVSDDGRRRVAVGAVVCTFAAAANTPVVLVNSGLGAQPDQVQLTPMRHAAEVRIGAVVDSFPANDGTFNVVAWAAAAITGPVTVFWMASL